MEQRVCSFCGHALEPGSGLMYIKRDGSQYFFDRRRCQVKLLEHGRLARRTKWTRHYPRGGAKAAEAALEAQRVAAEIAKAQAGPVPGAKKATGGRAKK
jgi:large subunit ribosomal protein L24e